MDLTVKTNPKRSCCCMLLPLEKDLHFLLMEQVKTNHLEDEFSTKHQLFRLAAGAVYKLLDDLWVSTCDAPDTDLRRYVVRDFVSRITVSWQRSEAKFLSSMRGVDLISHTTPPMPLREILVQIQNTAAKSIAAASNVMMWHTICLQRFKQIYYQIIHLTSRLLDRGVKLRYCIYFLKATPVLDKKLSMINTFCRQVLHDAALKNDAKSSISSAPPLVVGFDVVRQILFCPFIPRPQVEPLDLTMTPLKTQPFILVEKRNELVGRKDILLKVNTKQGNDAKHMVDAPDDN